MNKAESIWNAMESLHQKRKHEERELTWVLVVFSVMQSLRAGVWLAILSVIFALISGNWELFSAQNIFIASGVLLAFVGPWMAWQKIQK